MPSITPLEPPTKWLRQGDIMSSVPLWAMSLDGLSGPDQGLGPALLVTHGCELDKPTGNEPRIQRLQVVPLRSIEVIPESQRAMIRANKPSPAEALYLGPVAGFDADEAIVLFSEMLTLPARLFDLALGEFVEDAEQGLRCFAQQYGERLGTLAPDRVREMYLKLVLFWVRLEPDFEES